MIKALGAQIVTAVFVGNCFLLFPVVQRRLHYLFQQELNEAVLTFFGIGVIATCLTASFLLFQAILAGFYRLCKPEKDDSLLPKCSILIPAYNEGACILESLESILHSDYPAEKMEIVIVDDGSVDDTWEWIQKSCGKYPGRIRSIHLEKNGGKKLALCRGIRESSNEIIVTVDSDSCLEPGALRNLVSPFRKDERIGAVAGCIRVKDVDSNFLGRILDVLFVFGCNFMRGAQSVSGYVLCTPGAISAYRRSALCPELIEDWKNQHFLGAPATIGEDRALASLLLRSRWKIICQNNAVAWTGVPQTYTQLCKMLLRWNRGDIRECLMLFGFIFSRWTLLDWRWCCFQISVIGQFFCVLLPFIFIPSLFLSFWIFRGQWELLVYYLISVNGLWSLLPVAVYVKSTSLSKAAWGFISGLYMATAFSWICIYAVFTLRNSKWMTREKHAKMIS